MKTKRHLITLLFISLTIAAYPADKQKNSSFASPENPFAPLITREENQLLKQAMSAASTDTAAGLKILQNNELEKSGPAIDFAIGNLLFQEGQLAEAEIAYSKALEKLPKFRSALMNLGRVHLMRKNPAGAISLYQQLVEDGEANAEILLLLGHALLMEDEPVSAESAYRQTLLLHPRHKDAMLGLAKALMRQERFAESLSMVGEILEHDPVNTELWTLRSNAYLSMERYDDAIRTIEKARRLGCAEQEMLATLGDLLLNRNQPEDALSAYTEAFSKGNPSPLRMLRAAEGFLIIADVDNTEKMITRASKATEQLPADKVSDIHIRLLRIKANLAQQKNRRSEAMQLCKELLQLDPLDGSTLLLLAELQMEEKNLSDAIMTCERASRIKGVETDALVLQAKIEVQREDYKAAISLLEAAQTFKDQPHISRYLDQLRRMMD